MVEPPANDFNNMNSPFESFEMGEHKRDGFLGRLIVP
jgi:hypothetical protein